MNECTPPLPGPPPPPSLSYWATGLAKLAPVRGVTAYVSCPAVFVLTAWFVVLYVLSAWVRAGLLGLGVDGQQGLRGIPR